MFIWLIILTILITLAGGWLAMRFRDRLHLVLGFSAGALLGLVFFELLPESLEIAAENRLGSGATFLDARSISLFVMLGFLLYLILDRWFSFHYHDLDNCANQRHQGKLAMTSLIIHSALDGLVLAIGWQQTPLIGMAIAIAILSHRLADGLTLTGLMLRVKASQRSIWRLLVLDSLAPLIGIALGQIIVLSENYVAIALAIFAGFFLYLSASDLLPESHHSHAKFLTVIMTFLGVTVIYLISKF